MPTSNHISRKSTEKKRTIILSVGVATHAVVSWGSSVVNVEAETQYRQQWASISSRPLDQKVLRESCGVGKPALPCTPYKFSHYSARRLYMYVGRLCMLSYLLLYLDHGKIIAEL